MLRKAFQLSILSILLLPVVGFADAPPPPPSQQCQALAAVGGGCDANALPTQINTVIGALFTVAGAIAVIIMIVGGIRYITSTGDSSRIKSAKDTILYAIIGLVVVIISRAIVGFVAGQF